MILKLAVARLGTTMGRAKVRIKQNRRLQWALMIVASLMLMGLLVEYSYSALFREPTIKHNFDQSDVDYFAKTIAVTYTLVSNGVEGAQRDLSEAEISISNKGHRVFPGHDWEIFFSQMLVLEPEHYPYPEGYEKKEYGVRFYHWNGQLHSFEPTQDFGYLAPGMTKTIRVYTDLWNLAVTDTFPNWYIVFPGFDARVLANTAGDPFKFVYRVDSPRSWRKNADDLADLVTPQQRYADSVKDLGHAPLPAIPTFLKTDSYNPNSFFNVIHLPMTIVTDAMFKKEAKILEDQWEIPIHEQLPTQDFICFENGSVDVGNAKVVLTEAYSIKVNAAKRTINVKAMSTAGAFYAVQTLLALVRADGTIPEINIVDGPRYPYRGLMLDIARNFHGKDTIKRLLDMMSVFKLNKLHLHLSDDEGWRLQIPGLDELTEVGARRCHDPTETRCILPFLGAPLEPTPPGSGYLTVDDYKDLLRYAADRHIEIIPEIDFPGHSHAAIKAMEARLLKLYKSSKEDAQKYLLSDVKDTSAYFSVQRFKDNVVNPCAQSTYEFIKMVVDAIYNMHKNISPLKMLHMGGDETPESAWTASPLCASLNLTGHVRSLLKTIFVRKVSDILSSYDLELALWEDGFTGHQGALMRKSFFSRDVHAYVWNNVVNSQHAEKLARKGYKVILTGASNLYFDHPYELDPFEPGLYWARRSLTTRDVYSFVPEDSLKNGLDPSSRMCDSDKFCLNRKLNQLEGIQGTLFGELVRSQDIIDFMLLPRVIALAERAWKEAPWLNISDPLRRQAAVDAGWRDFANTLGYRQLFKLDRMGYKYRVPAPGARITGGVLYTSVEFPGLIVEMSRNGTRPWVMVISGQVKVAPGELVQLRTRSADSKRHSKVVSIINTLLPS